jgi:hypothetical protein
MMDGRAGHGQWLASGGVFGEFLDRDHLLSRGRYRRRRGVGRGLSSRGTIARPGRPVGGSLARPDVGCVDVKWSHVPTVTPYPR